jgi:hypothetical protein
MPMQRDARTNLVGVGVPVALRRVHQRSGDALLGRQNTSRIFLASEIVEPHDDLPHVRATDD